MNTLRLIGGVFCFIIALLLLVGVPTMLGILTMYVVDNEASVAFASALALLGLILAWYCTGDLARWLAKKLVIPYLGYYSRY